MGKRDRTPLPLAPGPSPLAEIHFAGYRERMLASCLIIAHAGASFDSPENTVAAARLAWQQRADAVETDVHITRDGALVCSHDASTLRRTGYDGLIESLPLKQLTALDAGAWKDPKFAGETIPTLEQLLDTVPPGKRVVIELKCKRDISAELRAALLRSQIPPKQIDLIAFDAALLSAARAANPDCAAYWLAGHTADAAPEAHFQALDQLIARAKQLRFDGLNLNHSWPIDATFVNRVHAAALKLYVWTVNDADIAARLRDAGVDGITTDRPGWLREQLDPSSCA